MSSDISKKKIQILACGGFGANIASAFLSKPSLVDGPQPPEVHFFDTSKSNLPQVGIDPKHVHLAAGADGAGKDRAKAADILRPLVPAAFKEMGSADHYLVIFSLGGGTGSVWGPLLIEQLLRQKKSFTVLIQSDNFSNVTIMNSHRTFEGLRRLPAAYGTSFPVFIREYRAGDNRAVIDASFRDAIEDLLILLRTSWQPNSELDSQDIRNWQAVETSCKMKPAMTVLSIFTTAKGEAQLAEADGTLTLASIYCHPDQEVINVDSIYRTIGYNAELANRQAAGTDEQPRLHFATSVLRAAEVSASLKDVYVKSEERAKELRAHEELDAVDGEDGLML